MKQSLNNVLVFGALLNDLSKAFDCLSHELLTAKLITYGVEISVRLTYDYSTNRRLRTKVGNKYSPWRDTLLGVTDRSILIPLLSNNYICDLFILKNDNIFCIYISNFFCLTHFM